VLAYCTTIMYPKKGNPFILASASPRRRDLLDEVGLVFEVIPALVEEVPEQGREPAEETVRIALDKALWVATRQPPGRWVLGADTIVVVDNGILGKPVDEEDAVRMLKMISGRKHRVITGWVIVKSPGEVARTGFVESIVEIRKMDERTIRAYVKTGEPMDKAGAYAVQGIGAFMVKAVQGSYTNVVGLPLCEVVEALEDVGASRIFPG